MAHNHALDYGSEALLETLEHLRSAGIACVGAGADRARARVLEGDGFRLDVLGCSDHPAEYAASFDAPGIAYGLDWLPGAIAWAEADAVLVPAHWGPSTIAAPWPRVRRSAAALRAAGGHPRRRSLRACLPRRR
jgi:poly-gamma-glutamate synthesis protein (capsule biosynthesis protein)